MELLPVGPGPRWRLAAILEISNDNISGMGRPIARSKLAWSQNTIVLVLTSDTQNEPSSISLRLIEVLIDAV